MTRELFFRNALLDGPDGSRHRVIEFDADTGNGVLILMGSKTALPYRAEQVFGDGWQRTFNLFKPAGKGAADGKAPASLTPLQASASAARIAQSEEAFARIAGIIDNPGIHDRQTRHKILQAHAAAGHGTAKTLLKLLREFWQGGQTQDALLGHWNNCGRPAVVGTGGRGRKTGKGQSSYQITDSDISKMRDIVETYYFEKDKRHALTDTLQQLHERHYTYLDGNGEVCLLPSSECPSYKQLDYFLKKNYPLEGRLRARLGDKSFEQNHRSTEGSIQLDCHGVGHMYEFDATIADVVLVSSADAAAIVGKPTLYLIIDRASRMIVGWYVGFENASYNAAVQAILTIGEDKEELCAYLGLPYDPADWVAHGILPEAFLADQGELTSKKARRIARAVRATLMNVPGLRPEWKPLVECGFAMLHQTIGPDSPGYVRDADTRRRRAPNVDKQASLSLKRFTTIIVAGIIAHNKSMQAGFPLSVDQVARGIRPIPRELYLDGMRRRMGKLDQMNFERVREELMPRDKAVITADGIHFRKLYYSCIEAEQRGWLVEGRRERKPIEVAFDYRLANEIIVYSPDGSGQSFVASLTGDSVEFKEMAFADVQRHFDDVAELIADARAIKREARHGYHKMTQPVIDAANAELKQLPKGTSRSSRKKDTAPARANELAEERSKAVAEIEVRKRSSPDGAVPETERAAPMQAANVIALRRPAAGEAPSLSAGSTSPAEPTPAVDRPLTLKERMALARKQMELG